MPDEENPEQVSGGIGRKTGGPWPLRCMTRNSTWAGAATVGRDTRADAEAKSKETGELCISFGCTVRLTRICPAQ